MLLMTTNPTVERWETMAELARHPHGGRARAAGLADTEAAFHVAGKTERNKLYVDDRVHRLAMPFVAETVLNAIAGAGK